MSLTAVTAEMAERARSGMKITVEEFMEVVTASLPEGTAIIRRAVEDMRRTGEPAVHNPPHMEDGIRGQLLRVCLSDAMRNAFARAFPDVRLGFQNCHAVAAFPIGPKWDAAYDEFVSFEAQILNQSPDRRDC